MSPFTVTSPTNALSIVVYGMFTFYGALLVVGVTVATTIAPGYNQIWSMLLLISSSTALYGVLTAPKRADPDRSLRIEFYMSAALCLLLGYLSYTISLVQTSTGAFPITSFGLCMIFCLGFGARAWQIFFERRSLHKFRQGPPPDCSM